MRRGRWADDPDAPRRSARDGVIRTAALRALGVPGATITNRCADGGRWTRLLPGVVLLTAGTPTRKQEIAAALLYGGPDTVLTGIEACRRHGVRRSPDPRGRLHVLVPDDRQLRSCEFRRRRAHHQVADAAAADLTAEGVTVLPVLPTSLRDDGDRSLAELEAAYAAAARRPRPPVVAIRRS